ncbi:hypothetical protein Pelo_3335 [Pelomyxa schiedti]|nr:hypothetical protein Pelo_3335 [Pelomyxa schiedti]
MSATHKRHPSQAIQRNTKLGRAALPVVLTDAPKRRRTAAPPPPKSSTPTSASTNRSTVHHGIATATSNTMKNPETPATRKNPVTTRPSQNQQRAAVTPTAREEDDDDDEDEDEETRTDPEPPPLTGNSTTTDRTCRPLPIRRKQPLPIIPPYSNSNSSSSGHKPMATRNVDRNQTGNQNSDISDELYNKACTCLVKTALNICKKYCESKAAAEAARAVAEAKAKAAMENIVVKHNLDTVSKEAMNELRRYYMTGTGMVGSCKILVELEKTINSVQKAPFGQGIDKPFIILDGSSGMGKTQLAFSLKEDVMFVFYPLFSHFPGAGGLLAC